MLNTTTTTSLSSERVSIEERDLYYNTITIQSERDLNYYLSYLSSLPPGYNIINVRVNEDFVRKIDRVAAELGLSRSKFVKVGILVFLDSLGKLEHKPIRTVTLNLRRVKYEHDPLQALLKALGIKKKIAKVVVNDIRKMIYIHFKDGTIAHLSLGEKKLALKKPMPYGLTTLEEYLIPEGFEIAIEG